MKLVRKLKSSLPKFAVDALPKDLDAMLAMMFSIPVMEAAINRLDC